MFHCNDQNRQSTASCYHSLHLTKSGIQIKAIIVNTREMVHFTLQSVKKMLLNHTIFKLKTIPYVLFVLFLHFIAWLFGLSVKTVRNT